MIGERKYLLSLSILNAVLFVLILIVFSSVFKFNKIITNPEGNLVFTEVIIQLKNLIVYTMYLVFYIIAISIGVFVAYVLSPIPDFNEGFIIIFIQEFFRNYLGLWFPFPNKKVPEIKELPELIVDSLLKFLNNVYLFSFSLLFVIAIIYFVRAVFQNDPKYSMISVGSLILMIIIPLLVIGINDMFLLFGIKLKQLNTLVNPLSRKFTQLPLDDFFAFLASPIALIAILCYIYLEFAFQINYIDTVTKPSLQRRDRLRNQLRIIRRESTLITANVDQIKEEAKKKREQMESKQEKVSEFFAETSERFSYVKEMIEKKKLEEEEKKLIAAASKTRRLGSYIEKLFKEDKEAENTLTARSSAPAVKSLMTSTAINFAFRIILLIVMSFIIIHPRWFFIYVFNMPPAITESSEMYSLETIIILLIPLMLIFPIIAQIISYVKHRNLIIRLKQEGRIKEILATVGDYVKMDEKIDGKDEKIEEVAQAATEAA